MDIPRILYEPYVIFLLVAFVISIFYFYIQKSNAKKQQQDPNYDEEFIQKNKYTNSFIAFLVSYLLLLIIYYGYKYFQTKQSASIDSVKSGGSSVASVKEKVSSTIKEQIKEKLTIIDDDIDIGVFEN